MAIKIFFGLPAITGFTEEGFEFSVDYNLYSDTSATRDGHADIVSAIGSSPSAAFADLYTAALNSAAEWGLDTPALSDIYCWMPMTFEQLGHGQSSVTRTLNSAFQISTTANVIATYSVDIASTLSVTTGQVGTVYLEIADDSGFTTNVQELSRMVNGNAGTLSIGLNNTQTMTAQLSGIVPLGSWTRLRTQQNTGTPTFTYRSGQEVIL